MSRKSDGHGTSTSDVEVTNVSKHGFWVLHLKEERFLSFDLFPWFRRAAIGDLLRVEVAAPGHLRWPTLDIDLDLASIDRPEDYPLVSKADLVNSAGQPLPPKRER
jgi:hypothetical protein